MGCSNSKQTVHIKTIDPVKTTPEKTVEPIFTVCNVAKSYNETIDLNHNNSNKLVKYKNNFDSFDSSIRTIELLNNETCLRFAQEIPQHVKTLLLHGTMNVLTHYDEIPKVDTIAVSIRRDKYNKPLRWHYSNDTVNENIPFDVSRLSNIKTLVIVLPCFTVYIKKEFTDISEYNSYTPHHKFPCMKNICELKGTMPYDFKIAVIFIKDVAHNFDFYSLIASNGY